jgi:RHS repeat-associated protein
MRYTINGSPPTSTSGTLITSWNGTVRLTPSPGGTTLRVIAYKPGMIDSQVHDAVFYYVNDNGGNSNVANPIDGGPGGGGVVIDGGNQPIISYDDNGNLIHYKEWNYRYDAQNRLTEAWNGTTTAQFYYDGKNRQIARNINGVVRFNSWDGWELVEEYGSGLTVAKGYLQGATGVIKSWDPIYGQLYYYQDKLGSTTHVTNAMGAPLESYRYDLYGTPSYYDQNGQLKANQVSGYGVNDLYAGERWVGELRLYDLRNRFLSPELGRFLQPDPIGFQGDTSNLYRYCGNDPVDRSDPTGLTGSTIAERMSLFYGDSSQRGSLFDLDHPKGVTMAYGSVDSGNAAEYKKGFDAAMSVRNRVGDRAAKSNDPDSPEAWAPYGQDPRTKMWGTGSIRDGNGVDKKFKDRYTEGVTERVQTSTISRGDLPAKYDFKGFVLGHKFFNAKFVDRDIKRAQDAHSGILIVLPPRPGAHDKGYLWKYWEPGHSVISSY